MIVKQLVALLGFKTDEQSAQKAEGTLGSLVKAAKVAAAAFASIKAIGALKGIAEQTAALGDKFDKMAQRTGIAADELQRWGHVAELSGASVESISMGVRKLALSIDMASKGSKEASDGFASLNVNVKKADGSLKTANELLPELADGIAALPNDTQRAAAAQRVLGESGVALLPLLKQGSAAIEAQRGELDALGGVIDGELIGLSTSFVDNQTRLQKGFQGVNNVIAKAFLPSLISVQESLIGLIKASQGWIRTNIGPVVKRLGGVMAGVQRLVVDVVAGFVAWMDSFTPLQRQIFNVSIAIAGLVALLLLPGGSILLLIGLIGILIEDFQTWREGGESAIGKLIDSLGQLLNQFPALKEALLIIWEQTKTTFTALRDIVFSFVQFWIDLFTKDATAAFEGLGTNLADVFSNLWSDIGTSMQDALNGWLEMLGNFASSALDAIVSPFKSAKNYIAGLFGGDEGGTAATTARGLGNVATAGPAAMATPLASASPSRSGNIFSPQTSVGVNVTAAPGMNEERLAQAVARQVENAIESQNRMAIQALSPAAATGG